MDHDWSERYAYSGMTGANIGVLNVLTRGGTWKLPSCRADYWRLSIEDGSRALVEYIRHGRGGGDGSLVQFDIPTDTLWKGVEGSPHLESLGSGPISHQREEPKRQIASA